MRRTQTWLVAGIVLASLSACVTINIYFPAAAAEKAADRIIDEVWQLKQKEAATQGAPEEKAQ
jgi:predicted small lipoprotein YifL